MTMKQFLTTLLGVLAAAVGGGEPYMVVAETAGLFAGTKQRVLLRQGEIVNGEEHAWNKESLRVKYRGKEFLAPRKSFGSRRETLLRLDRERAELEADIKGINKQLAAYEEQRLKLVDAVLHMEHNTALAYKARSGGVQVKNRGVRLGNTGAKGKLIYVVTEKKAAKSVKGWHREIEEIDAKVAGLEAERLAAVTRVHQAHRERLETAARFARYAENPRTYLLEPYRADRKTQMTRKGVAPEALEEGDWVWAQLHPGNAATLLIRYRQKAYLAARENFTAWTEVEAGFLKETVELEDKARRLERRVKVIAEQLKLYPPLLKDLRYRSNTRKSYVYIPEIQVRPGSNGMTGIELPQQPNVIYAQIIEVAQKVLPQWRRELEDLAVERRKAMKTLKLLREQQEALDERRKHAQAGLDRFRKNE